MIMAAIMTMGLIACGKKDSDDSGQTSVSTETSTSKESDKEEVSTTEAGNKETNSDGHDWPFMSESLGLRYVTEVYNKCDDLTDWGNYKDFRLKDQYLYIKYPSLIPTGSNFVAYQKDKTVVLFMHVSESGFANSVTDAESILNVAIENEEDYCGPIELMKDYWRVRRDGYLTMTINSAEQETVGQYECCKYTGTTTHLGNNDTEETTNQFVAYSSFTKNGNEPFYWMVFDESEDQSLGSTIADYAKKMGLTIVEDPDEK